MVTLEAILELVEGFAKVGGGLWLVWGVVILASGLKDKNGPALQSGIWQIVGGALIIAAATYFGTIKAPKTPKVDSSTPEATNTSIMITVPDTSISPFEDYGIKAI